MITILIVEDSDALQKVMSNLVEPIVRKWPQSSKQFVKTFEAALEIANREPAPDIILLDLSLPDSTMESTIDRLDMFWDRSPVLIVTGHTPDEVREAMKDHAVPVLYKQDMVNNDGYGLIKAIASTMDLWHRAKFERMEKNIQRLREIAGNATP